MIQKKIVGLIISIFFLSGLTYCQIDTAFWFAVPEVTSRHADEPVFLRIATLNSSASISVSIPSSGISIANNISLSANSSYSIDLTSYKNNLETAEANINQVLNKGLYIKSSDFITAYYEVLGSVDIGKSTERIVNTDIFSLKGTNALGTEFYVPFQNLHQNVVTDFWGTDIRGKSTIDIVATENNTTITIYPTKPYRVGTGSSTAPVTVSLNKGQTYSMEAFGPTGAEHLSGTRIVSSKPIAVTMKDDSIIEAGMQGYDLAGDQIIPVGRVGKEYIVFQGFAFITATADNTTVTIGGVNVATINKGETYSTDLRAEPNAVYIVTSEPAYMHHLVYFDEEMGSAVMPPLQCTGSTYVSVNRSSFNYGEKFYLLLTVQSGSESDFIVQNSNFPSGTNTIIQASDFTVVSGTGGNWLYAFLVFDDLSEIPLGSTIVKNTSGMFHMGIMNGKSKTPSAPNPINVNATGYRYGYFTDFGNLNVIVSIPDKCILQGDSLLVYPGKYQNYTWSTGSIDTAVYIKQSGNYNVTVTNGDGCLGTGRFTVAISQLPDFTLGPDIVVCDDKPVDLEPVNTNFTELGNLTYTWNTGSAESSLTTTGEGEFTLEVKNNCGAGYDTINVIRVPVSAKNLFTPNADGQNETFMLEGLENIGKWELNIFNRWGQRVFSSEEYDNSWNGLNVKEGVYYYSFIDKSGMCADRKGWVQIVK